MPRCCVLLADGFEEIEAVTVIDVLRRAEIEVTTLGLSGRQVTGSHAITVEADETLDARLHETWDLVVLPGGMPGSANLRDDPRVQALVKAQDERGGQLAAICAAPIALASAGVLSGRRATSYPTFGDQLGDAVYATERVVRDGNLTTSRGPGTALDFALGLVERLAGAETASTLRHAMLVESGATSTDDAG